MGEKDPASLVESSKLFLNNTDDAFFQDYLVQLREPLNPRGLPKSNRLLWECFKYFRARIADDVSLAGSGATMAALMAEVAGRQLMFILITVDDDLNAYTVFETPYAAKLVAYQSSAYTVTSSLPELAPQEWTPALIDERQRRLAARAVHLWRADAT